MCSDAISPYAVKCREAASDLLSLDLSFCLTKLQVLLYPQTLQRELMPDQSPLPCETPCKPAASDTLLIVEDDAVFADRLARSLEDKGYLVRSASSISEAIDCVSEEPPAYAIVDMRLPDGNGLDFVSSLKKGSPDCRAVILTGYGNIPSAVVAIEAGAFDFLAKPADADEIHNALRTARHDEVFITIYPSIK